MNHRPVNPDQLTPAADTNNDSAILYTLEQRLRSTITSRTRVIARTVASRVAATLNTDATSTGALLISNPAMHNSITESLNGAERDVQITVRAGHRAATKAALVAAAASAGLQSTPDLPDSDTLAGLLTDLRRAFAIARADLLDAIRDGHDGVTGGDTPAAITTARNLVIRTAIDRAIRRLNVRLTALSAVAVHRGYTDGQMTVYEQLIAAKPYLRYTRRWLVTSTNPCPACAALDGSEVDEDHQFDATASTDPEFTPPPTYPDLHGPPRHPSCRCRLVIDLTEASAELRRTIAETTIATGRRRRRRTLTAAQIRRMPAADYTAVTAMLDATTTKLRHLRHR